MKINGKPLASRNKATVTLKRNEEVYTFTLIALPPGWNQKIRSLGLAEYPKVPREMMKTKSGNPIRDQDTGKVIFEENYSDPAYQAERHAVSRRFAALQFAELMSEEPSVEFTSTPPVSQDKGQWKEYAESLANELFDVESGFTQDEVDGLIEIGLKLEARLDIAEGYKDFLSLA